MDGVHPLPSRRDRRYRLRVHRHRAAAGSTSCSSSRSTPGECTSAASPPTRPARGRPRPHATSSCDSARSRVPVPHPRWRRPVHPHLRHAARRIGDHRDPDPATSTPSKRVRGAVGAHAASRVAGPDNHLERTPTPSAARRLHRALQRAPTPPRDRPTSPQRHRSRRRDPTRPADPTTHHLQRAHQRVPTRRLTIPATATDQPTPRISAPQPLPHRTRHHRTGPATRHRLVLGTFRGTSESVGAVLGFELAAGPAHVAVTIRHYRTGHVAVGVFFGAQRG